MNPDTMWTRTEQDLALITPEQALNILVEGNKRFLNNLAENRDLLKQVNRMSQEHRSFAVVLSCIDSGASAELIFDQGLGDIFSLRTAGNYVNEDILGSLEYACKLEGAKLILILGHTRCAIVKGACNDVRVGNYTALLNKLRPAVDDTASVGSHDGSDPYFVDLVMQRNVELTMEQITERSAILRDMLEQGSIGLAGGTYDMDTGIVKIIDHPDDLPGLVRLHRETNEP
jgi:carbonic anhydrase